MEPEIGKRQLLFGTTQRELNRMGHIVIVDDDPIVRHFLHRMLSIQGYECLTFDQGQDALQHFLSHRPAVIIMDNHMSSMTGIQFLEQVSCSKEGETIPVILLTKNDDQQDVCTEKVRSLGVHVILTKPLDYRKISIAVESVIS